MKNLKKIFAILLVASMILTTNATMLFATEVNQGTEEQIELSDEETTVEANEEPVGSKLGEPEEDIDENLSEPAQPTRRGERLSEPEEDTRRGERLSEPALDEEEAEEETEAESEIELELDKNKKDDQLYGDVPKNFYVVFYYNDENYSSWTLSESNINSVADDDEKQYFVDNLFDELIYNLSAAEPRGFYKIGDDIEYSDINYARQAYDRWSDATIELEKDKLLAEYESWVNAGAEHDVYYGTLINAYFYLLHYDSDGNPAFIKVKCTDTEDTVNDYLDTIKGNAPSGKKFKTWQYWHADWYEEEGYDYSDDGEKEFYENLVEDSTKAYDDTALIAMFNSWINTDKPYENRHFGAIYEDAPAPTTYTVTYNQNLPSGYTLSDGKTWYSVATTSDLSGNPIELEGSADMTCEDASGNVRTLEGWNTAAGGAGTPHAFGETINDDTEFTGDTLDLYAVWSDPVAPGPAGSYIYWIVDGEGENKTIHYYNTDGTGRTKLEIGADGVEYKNLTKDDIKKAVIEEPIVATDARGFFQAFYELESIDNLANLNTSNATSFAGMFSLCYKLDDIKLSSFNTKKVTDTSRMFSSCSSLTSLTFGDNFDTSKVTNMAGMFDSCNSLTSITFGSNFKTNNVTNMSDMFCAVGLEKLDLTSFDTSKVTDMRNMFVQSQIKTIYVSDDFIVDQVANSEYMFYYCKNLVGGKGTKYDDVSDPWDRKYAHIDEGSTNPGFFTAAPTPTPPTPSPSPSYSGGTTGGSDSDGSSSGGPKVTNNNITVNNIPQSLLLNDPALYLQLMSYPENTYMQKTNAKDIHSNTGYGRWMRIPNTTTWYFYAGDFNGVGNAGFLKDGWFNLGWDGVDRWYRFDSNGVMQLGWYEENGKIYFLQNDLNDNWYGKAVTGTHVIDGVTYTFDSTGALIQ